LSVAGAPAGPAALWAAIYAAGRPVQYSYLSAPLELWDVQTAYASRPWAFEAPSAGLPLDGATLVALRRRGIAIATLTHAAGLSSRGAPATAAALPLPARSDIPAETVAAIETARSRGGRVVAVGTTVVRALEGAAASAAAREGVAASAPVRLVPGPGETDLKI